MTDVVASTVEHEECAMKLSLWWSGREIADCGLLDDGSEGVERMGWWKLPVKEEAES